MDIWVFSIFWLLWVMLLWTFMYKILCGYFFFISLRYTHRGGIVGSNSIPMFNFLRNYHTVFQSSFNHFDQQCYEGSDFSTSSFSIITILGLITNNAVINTLHLHFLHLICILPMANMLGIFPYAYWLFLGKKCYSEPLPIFELGYSSFYNWLYIFELFIYSRYKFLIRYITSKCFLPFCVLSFHTLDNILWSTKVFNLDEVQFIYFVVVACVFHVISKKSLPN